ncbi:MAG: cysteine desulfurase [Candidatus Marinimicrobia bacterium]|nr:cysteine desulfurase [Candidatus Neomarinimicrobiota bacterium]
MDSLIYLDNNATTPLDPRVLEVMLPYYKDRFGNAASIHHRYGHEAKITVENSRKILANELNAKIREIVFTSGATESINLAIKGVCENEVGKKNHIITQSTEHKAVLDVCESMEKRGFEVTYLPVNSEGGVEPNQVKEAMRDETVLVAIMHANNEIGTIQPIKEIGEICRENSVYFLVDAAQSFGKLSIDVKELNIDLLAASAHKIYGPKGIGLLYVNQKNPRIKLKSQIEGGGHERGFRSGTLPVALIAGFGEAVKIASINREKENEYLSHLRDKMINEITANHFDTIVNGSRVNRLSNNINLCFPGIDAETLIMKMKGVACSTSSACSSANLEPSHVIKALGHNNELAHSAVRFSLGRFNTEDEIDRAITEINKTVSLMKENSPRQRLLNV